MPPPMAADLVDCESCGQSRVAPRSRMLEAATFSTLLGILHPFFTECSKSAYLREFKHGVLMRESRVMPFHLITLTLTAQMLAVLTAVVVVCCRRSSMKEAARELLDPRPLWYVLPIGAMYGVGDFLQTMACNKSSTPVVLLVGQSKLFQSALLSKLLLGTSTSSWIRLMTISLASVASIDISAQDVSTRSDQIYGGILALLKAFLSTLGAVLSERAYKGHGKESGFWVVSFRVQLSMLLTSLFTLGFIINNDSEPLMARSEGLHSFYSGGPYVPCPHGLPAGCGEQCVCSTRSGWDGWTVMAMLGIVVNGYATGFFLKHLSTVCKAVCNLGSSGLCCVACWMVGCCSCTMGQVAVAGIVLLQSYEYAMEKVKWSKALASQAASWSESYVTVKGSAVLENPPKFGA